MNKPYNLSEFMAKELEAKGFQQTVGSPQGMYATYVWGSAHLEFWLSYDRGYYECGVSLANGNPKRSFHLVPLLGFIFQDKAFYKKETALAGQYGLSPDGFVWLFLQHLSKIEEFFDAGGHEQHADYVQWIRGVR